MTKATATTLAIVALLVGGLGGYAASRSYNNSNYPAAPNTGATQVDYVTPTPVSGSRTSTTNYYTTTQNTTYTYVMATSSKALALRDAMRSLWNDHVRLTRQFIVETAASSSGATATANQLLKNQEAIGNAMKPYYGTASGNNLTSLLKTHINQAAELVKAAKNNDANRVESLKQQWFTNADDIARFLNTANPSNWTYDHIDGHMRDHLNLTLEEATDQLAGRYDESVNDFNQIGDQIQRFADELTNGIVQQFPDRFR